jgi:EEF1A lysine methyltransferase 4
VGYIPVTVAVFGEEMVEDGYQDVVNIDISSVVIDQMTKKYHDKPQLKCNILCCLPPVLRDLPEYVPSNMPSIDILIGTDIKMDVRDMSHFQSGSFDAVIDKGTIVYHFSTSQIYGVQ